MADAVRRAGLPGRVSDSAGTFVCNYLFYRLMDRLGRCAPAPPGGFFHVPYTAEQAAAKGPEVSGLPLSDLVRGVAAALEAVAAEAAAK